MIVLAWQVALVRRDPVYIRCRICYHCPIQRRKPFYAPFLFPAVSVRLSSVPFPPVLERSTDQHAAGIFHTPLLSTHNANKNKMNTAAFTFSRSDVLDY